MQFIKISLPLLACVATLSTARPIDLQGDQSQLTIFETRDLSFNLKRSGMAGAIFPAAFLAATTAGLGGFGIFKGIQSLVNKEAQDFLLSNEGEVSFPSWLVRRREKKEMKNC